MTKFDFQSQFSISKIIGIFPILYPPLENLTTRIAVIKAVPDYQKLHSDASGMTTARQIGKWSKVELE